MSQRSYVSAYDLPSSIQTKNTSQGKNTILKLLVLAAFAGYTAIRIYEMFGSSESLMNLKENIIAKSLEKKEKDDNFEDPGNIMILGKPWKFLRDTTKDLPVRDDDISYLWFTRGASGQAIRTMLTDCFELKLAQYNKGIDMVPDLGSFSRTKGISSPNVMDVAALFTDKRQGRMFAFFRHPFQVFNESNIEVTQDNPLVRELLGPFDGLLTFKELGIAKKVIREKCVVGLLDENLAASVERITDHFGWPSKDGFGQACFEKHKVNIPEDTYGDLMDLGGTPIWEKFIKMNRYDLQLYEYVRSTFRAHEQTIVTRDIQLKREIGDEKEDEERK